MTQQQLFYEDVKENTEIPELVVVCNTLSQVKWAGINKDYDPEHYNKEYALSIGLPNCIVNGVNKLVLFARMLMNWTGDKESIKKLSCQHRGMDIVGDAVTFKGITKKCVREVNENLVECEVWAENPKGEKTSLGTAVVALAYAFMSILVVRATYHMFYPIQMLNVCSTTPELLYVVSASGQAFTRNIGAPYYALGYTAGQSATKQYFYEAAAYLLSAQASGLGLEDVHPNKAVVKNGALPIDSEFTCSLAHGNVGITRKEANSIIKKLMEKYLPNLKNPPTGRVLDQCYDLETMKPDDELAQLYDEVIQELKGYGINFK